MEAVSVLQKLNLRQITLIVLQSDWEFFGFLKLVCRVDSLSPNGNVEFPSHVYYYNKKPSHTLSIYEGLMFLLKA